MRIASRIAALLVSAAATTASFASAQTLNTTTTFDGTSGSYGGVLTVDSNGGQTPTLYLLNGATQTAGLSVVFIGNQYTGALALQGASSLSNSGVAILANFEGTSTGTATIAGGSRWTSGGNLLVGGGGNGYLNINSGGVVGNSNGFIAYGQGFNGQNVSTGTALVSGVGSTWNNQRLFVGGNLNNAGGTGSLNVSAGGAVNVSETLKIYSSGTVMLDGGTITARSVDRTTGTLNFYAGTLTTSGGQLTYAAGTGTAANILRLDGNTETALPVLQLNVGATVVGAEATVVGGVNQGSLVVSGGSTLTNGGSLTALGSVGGATISRGDGYLGLQAGAHGTATVAGAGSKWVLQHDLYVGGSAAASGGTGSLTVTGGGSVTAGGQIKIWQNGTVTVGAGSSLGGAVNNAGQLVLNGTLTGNVAVGSGGTLGGSGVVAGTITGAGIVAPGNSPGILTASQVDPTSGLDFLFQFTAANTAPTYGSPTNSLNDVLHLTHATDPFMSSIFSASNTITIDFEVGSLVDGQYFLGGFFTNLPGTDFIGNGTFDLADFEYQLNGAPLDLGQWHVSVSSLAQTGVDFGGGPVDGRVMKFQISEISSVPEPGSLILCGTAAAGYYLRRRRRRREELEPRMNADKRG